MPVVGVCEAFRTGEHERVERVIRDLRELEVTHVRTIVSWADWHAEGGEAWYGWLLPRLARDLDVLPCFHYTPPSLGVASRPSSPPREPKAYADFLDVVITRYGGCFDWVELWNEPNNLVHWDATLDPTWLSFARTVGGAAYWARKRGKRTLLGGMSPIDPTWLDVMFERGVMRHIDAVGIHAFPGTWETRWEGWPSAVGRVQEVLDRRGSDARIWITQTGFSTWQHDALGQLQTFLDASAQPVERVYWYAAEDLHPRRVTVAGFHVDEREYHFGMREPNGSPKLLAMLWARHKAEGIRQAEWLAHEPRFEAHEEPVVITGGVGFLGTNLAHRLLAAGRPVLLLDNLSRPGVYDNLLWLRETHGARARILVGDMRNERVVRQAIRHASAVFHLAAQVAVTTSLAQPVLDFEVNARGTFNLLEAIRARANPPPLVFTSTNKVYGAMEDVRLRGEPTRYVPEDPLLREHGFNESRSIDFHSPYGCSKGAADQYVCDYARSYGLPAIVFRMSCIYGPHQHGTEDQGWVAHFLLQALRDEPLTIYGDGRQVRDVLYVDDLVDAFLRAERLAASHRGRAFNVGGGPRHTASLLELVSLIGEMTGIKPRIEYDKPRVGDQPYYVSDTRAWERVSGWRAEVGVAEGLERLHAWIGESGGAAPRALVRRRA